jgi:hypothetical protein
MAVYNHDIQAAVDATSVAMDAGSVPDAVALLRDELAKREIETRDDAWLTATVEAIRSDPNAMVADGPRDFDPGPHQDHRL